MFYEVGFYILLYLFFGQLVCYGGIFSGGKFGSYIDNDLGYTMIMVTLGWPLFLVDLLLFIFKD